MQPHNKIKSLFFVLTTLLFQGCLSTASLSDLSRSSKSYDFSKIAEAKNTETDKMRNTKTSFEYYIKTGISNDTVLTYIVTNALKNEGFYIRHINKTEGVIFAERGLRANEWSSVAGVYFTKANDYFELYITCRITQDLTGGWREDRAKKIGDRICVIPKACLEAYSVNTITAPEKNIKP